MPFECFFCYSIIDVQTSELIQDFINDQGNPFTNPIETAVNVESYCQWKLLEEWYDLLIDRRANVKAT